MNLIVLGSRIYAPLSDVDVGIAALPPGSTVIAYGSSDVCKRSVVAAQSAGIEARNATLSNSRRELIEAATQPDAHVLLFVARDPATKAITEGIVNIAALLEKNNVQPRIVESPLPGRICHLMTKQRQAIDAALEAAQKERRVILTQRALKANTELLNARDEYAQRLAQGLWLQVDDEAATDKWMRWEFIYRMICNAIEDARALLDERAKAVAA